MENTPTHTNAEAAISLIQKISFRPEKFNSNLLFREDEFSLTLFALMEGQEIQEHKTSRNAYLQCIKGKVTITIGGIEYPLKKGEIILLPKAILHGVKAWRKTILLLMK